MKRRVAVAAVLLALAPLTHADEVRRPRASVTDARDAIRHTYLLVVDGGQSSAVARAHVVLGQAERTNDLGRLLMLEEAMAILAAQSVTHSPTSETR